jgi:hypothetical protein
LQHASGGYFSVENPATSFIWKFGALRSLDSVCSDVIFDQCMYGLAPSSLVEPSVNTFIRKRTCVKTNLHALMKLQRSCDAEHLHLHCKGQVKTSHGWVSVAREAGHYPLDLCRAWATIVKKSLAPTSC